MTVIVYRDGVMCADSGSWQGETLVPDRKRKVFKINGHLVGKMGPSAVTSGMIAEFKRSGKLDPARTKGEEATLIVVTPTRKILLYQKGDIEQMRGTFWCDGSEARIAAWGAMMAGASAHQALKIAIKLGPWAVRPIFEARL